MRWLGERRRPWERVLRTVDPRWCFYVISQPWCQSQPLALCYYYHYYYCRCSSSVPELLLCGSYECWVQGVPFLPSHLSYGVFSLSSSSCLLSLFSIQFVSAVSVCTLVGKKFALGFLMRQKSKWNVLNILFLLCTTFFFPCYLKIYSGMSMR